MSEETETNNDEQIIADLDLLKAQVFPNVKDGSLLIVTVGDEATPATKSDMERVATTVDEVFEDVKGVRVLIIPHLVQIENLSLPALRNIESQVVKSWNEDSGAAVIADCDEVFNVFGDL